MDKGFGLTPQLANLMFGDPPADISATKNEAAFNDTNEAAELLEPSLVHLPSTSHKQAARPRLFLFHDGTGSVDHLKNLEGFLDFPCTLVPLTSRVPLTSLVAMAQHYTSVIQSYQDTGPYLLGGYSFGARTAYEVAKLLEANGQQVQGLLCIEDPPFYDPAYSLSSRVDVCRAAACLAFEVSSSEGSTAVDELVAGTADVDLLCSLVKQSSLLTLSPLLRAIVTADPELRKPSTQAFVTGTCRIVYTMAQPSFLKGITTAPIRAAGALVRVTEAKREEFRRHIPLELEPYPKDYGLDKFVITKPGVVMVDASHEALFSYRFIAKTATAINQVYTGLLP